MEGAEYCSASIGRPGFHQVLLRVCYLLLSSWLLLEFILLWNFVLAWVSIISGLVLFYCLGYFTKNCYMLFCMPRVFSEPYLVERVSVCLVVVQLCWWGQFRGIVWKDYGQISWFVLQ